MQPDALTIDWGLCTLAVSTGFLHTLFGPDHYLPFVAMARVGRWSQGKTMLVTLLCGIAHVLSSVVLGLIGLAIGMAVFKLEHIEEVRGDVAGWLLLSFGVAYFVWGLAQALRQHSHGHAHAHVGQADHDHGPDGLDPATRAKRMTPWVLFTIFLFGPCEPLIPVLMYPAAMGNFWGVLWVALLFSLTTVATMLCVVLGLYLGLGELRWPKLARFGHALAGLVLLACGLAIKLGF